MSVKTAVDYLDDCIVSVIQFLDVDEFSKIVVVVAGKSGVSGAFVKASVFVAESELDRLVAVWCEDVFLFAKKWFDDGSRKNFCDFFSVCIET